MPKTLGDEPIQEDLIKVMNDLASFLDSMLNDPKWDKKKNGFVLLVFPFDTHEGRCNYISNADRKDIVILMKEQIKRFEGQPEVKGHA